MSAGLERDREHPVAVLARALKVWMTMTGLKAAQAAAMMAGPKLANATDLAEISCATALERGPSYPTFCKKLMVFAITSSAPTEEAPKAEDPDPAESTDRHEASTSAGWMRPKRFLSV